MPIATDFEVQTGKNIRYIGAAHTITAAGYYSVLELHRFLQDLADDQNASGDDFVDISRDTPSDKSFDTIITLINGYNIDDTAAEHLFGGSIIQAGGDTIYDGIQVIAAAGAHVQAVQNGALVTGDFWNSIPFGSVLKGLNPDVANGISHRFLMKVRASAADIDGRRVLFQTREFGFTFTEFKINGTSRGINVAALGYAADLNNATSSATVAGWSDVALLTAGYNGIDANGDGSNEFYYSKWDRASRTINQFYERLKYLTRRGTADTLYGINGALFRGITHEVALTTPRTGTFSANEAVSWGSGATAGAGRMLAIDSTTVGTKMWIQLMTGVAPSASVTITGGTSTATATNTGTPTERPLSFPFLGVSTGSALIGAYGFGLEAADLAVNDKVFDLTNTLRQPPNLVTFTVSGLVVGEDNVLVAPSSAGVIQANQFTLNGALSGGSVTAVVVNETIPTDTPSAGTLRITRANGAISRHAYSAYNAGTKTFTISSTNFSTNNASNGANAFLSYIDKVAAATSETFSGVYASDRNLFVRVRDGGATPIKTFETVAVLGSTGGNVTAIRTSDA